MGSNDIIKPLSTDLSRAVIESLQHRIILISEKFRECRESNPGPLGVKRERYPLCYAAPQPPLSFVDQMSFRSKVLRPKPTGLVILFLGLMTCERKKMIWAFWLRGHHVIGGRFYKSTDSIKKTERWLVSVSNPGPSWRLCTDSAGVHSQTRVSKQCYPHNWINTLNMEFVSYRRWNWHICPPRKLFLGRLRVNTIN